MKLFNSIKKKSVKKNYVYNLLYELFLLIIPIIVTPYVARVLGETGSGQYSFTYSVSTYFTLFASLGFSFYAQRLVASHQDDKEQQSKDFWEIFFVRLIPVGITLAIYIVLAGVGVYGEKYNVLMSILSINVIAVAFDITFFFKGNEEFGRIVLRNIIIKSISIVFIYVFVKDSDDLWIYALIQSGAVILSNLSLWLYLPKQLVKIKLKELRPLKHLKPTIILFLPTIATSVYTSLDKTLIGLITRDDAENGNYEYAEKLVKMALTVLTSLGTVMIPRNSKKFADGDIKGVEANIYKTTKFVLFIGVPLMFGIIAVADNLIPWYLGSEYDKASTLMKILSPLIPLIGLSNVFGIQFLIPSNQDKKYTLAVILGAVVNLVLNLVLIYFLKSYGAAIATVIAETVVTGVMLVFLRKNIKFGKILISSWKYWIAGITMYVVLYFAFKGYKPSILHTLFMSGCGVLIYFSVLTLLKDKYVWSAYNKIGMFINKIYRRPPPTSTESKIRNLSLDALKIFACFGVVILHTLDKNSGPAAQVLYYLGTVSIPLFFMVNGALLLNRDKITVKYCLLKIVRIVLITLFWSTLLFFVHAIINRDFSEWYIDIFGCFIQKGYFNIFWFFGSLIIIYLFLPVIHRIYKSRTLSVILLLALLVSSITIYEISVFRCCNGKDMLAQHVIQTFRLWTHLTYFVGGAFLYRIRKSFSDFSTCIVLPILCILLFALTAYCFYMGTCVLSTGYAEYMYDSPVVILIAAFVFVAFNSFKFNSNALAVISKATMGVYILHYNFIYPVLKYFSSGTLAYNFLVPVMVFMIAMLISVIVNQTKFAKKVIAL
ncbi:MAG: oligosaccharide flippase family protein [Clostridia bacterium]|nr:oligosaccharide flippase family protein [Clostridia bacterium]